MCGEQNRASSCESIESRVIIEWEGGGKRVLSCESTESRVIIEWEGGGSFTSLF